MQIILYIYCIMKLGNKIRICRAEADRMSQETLANQVGVTRQTIHSIENGKFIPSTLLAFRIARTFNKCVEDVFFIDDNE